MAAPYLMAQVGEGHFNQVCLAAWIPWAFLAYEILRAGSQWGVLCLSIVLAMGFFCGHVQELYYLVLFLTLFVITDLCAAGSSVNRKRLLHSWIGAGALTAGLVAIELLPEFLVSRQAVRSGGFSLAEAAAISLGPSSFRQLLDPFALGGSENYQGPGLFFWETLFHFGWMATLLAVLGFLTGWRNPRLWCYGFVGLLATIIAFGESTPVYGWVFQTVPGFSLFRAPARGLFFTSFVIAVLAAGGTDWVLRHRHRSLAIGIAAILLLVIARETVRNSQRILAVVPAKNIRQDSPITQYLAEHAGMRRVLVHQDLLTEREAWQAGIFKVHGYDPVPLTRTAILFDALVPNQGPANEVVGLKPALPQRFHPALVELLGVKYAVVPSDAPLPKAGWKLVQTGEVPRDVTLGNKPGEMLGYQILERESTFPRAFVLGQTRLLHSRETLSQQLSTLSPRKELLVHQDVLPQGDRQLFAVAEILEYSPNRVVIEATLEHPGYLVLTDIYAPGWTATVNGTRGIVVPVNVAFRGVPLPAGSHRVELTYAPPGWKIGLAISGLSFFLWLGLLVRRFSSDENSENKSPSMHQP